MRDKKDRKFVDFKSDVLFLNPCHQPAACGTEGRMRREVVDQRVGVPDNYVLG